MRDCGSQEIVQQTFPRRLKPRTICIHYGWAEAHPFQSEFISLCLTHYTRLRCIDLSFSSRVFVIHTLRLSNAPTCYLAKRREWQNHEIHDFFHCGAKEQATHQRVLRQKLQLAAGRIVNRRGGASDEEVQHDAKNVGADASMKSL